MRCTQHAKIIFAVKINNKDFSLCLRVGCSSSSACGYVRRDRANFAPTDKRRKPRVRDETPKHTRKEGKNKRKGFAGRRSQESAIYIGDPFDDDDLFACVSSVSAQTILFSVVHPISCNAACPLAAIEPISNPSQIVDAVERFAFISSVRN